MVSLSLSGSAVEAPLRRGAMVGRARRVRRVATLCAPSAATEGETLAEVREAHLAAEAAALAARREEREARREEREALREESVAHLAAEAAALAARREERDAHLAERLALLAETKEKREDKFAERTAASAEKAAQSSVKAAINGETMANLSAVGVGVTLLLALTMLVLRAGMLPT